MKKESPRTSEGEVGLLGFFNSCCLKKKRNEVGLMSEMCFSDSTRLLDRNMWIADSGATTHMTGDRGLLINIRDADAESKVCFGNGDQEEVMEVGDLRGVFLNKLEKKQQVLLQDVSFVPNLTCNLFSATKALN